SVGSPHRNWRGSERFENPRERMAVATDTESLEVFGAADRLGADQPVVFEGPPAHDPHVVALHLLVELGVLVVPLHEFLPELDLRIRLRLEERDDAVQQQLILEVGNDDIADVADTRLQRIRNLPLTGYAAAPEDFHLVFAAGPRLEFVHEPLERDRVRIVRRLWLEGDVSERLRIRVGRHAERDDPEKTCRSGEKLPWPHRSLLRILWLSK